MGYTWDDMYEDLKVPYGGLPNRSTQDMLDQFWIHAGYPDGTLGNDAKEAFYRSQGALGDSLGDLEHDYWHRVGANIMAAKGAVFAIDATQSVSGEQWVLNRGSGGQALRAKYGSVARAEIRNGIGLVGSGGPGNAQFASIPFDSVWDLMTGSYTIEFEAELDDWNDAVIDDSFIGTYATAQGWLIDRSLSGVFFFMGAGPAISIDVSAVPKGASRAFSFDYNSVTGASAGRISADGGVTWTTAVTGTTGSPVASGRALHLGGNYITRRMPDVLKWARVFRDGVKILDVDFRKQADLATSFVCDTGQTVTVTAANAVDTNDPLWLSHTGENYVYHPGTSLNGMSIASLVTGDANNQMHIKVRHEPESWTPAIERTLLSYTVGDPNRSVRFTVNSGGRLVVGIVPTGSVAGGFISAQSTVSVPPDSGLLNVAVTINGDVSGSYEVKFWTAPGNLANPGVSDWIQLGATVTGAAFTFATVDSAWATSGSNEMAGKFYSASVANQIDGTPAWSMSASEIPNGSATSFTCSTGQTVSITRSASGRKMVVVTRPVWLFGTDDYLEVSDNDLLDFASGQDFTIIAIARVFGNTDGALVSKKNTGALGAGWWLRRVTSTNLQSLTDDGVAQVATGSITNTDGLQSVFVMRRLSGSQETLVGTVSGGGSPDTLNMSSSTPAVRIGATAAGILYLNGEVHAVGIFRRALTTTEIAEIVSYYNAT